MPSHWMSETPDEERRRRFWNTAPADPVRLAQKSGVPHYNQPLGRALMPQSLMPLGPHRQMTLERVPAAYFLWVQAQPWSATWTAWEPVADYLTRFPPDAAASAAESDPGPFIFAGPLQICPVTPVWRWDKHARLTCAPGHEDKLETFALGALGLPAACFIRQRGQPPHYRLSPPTRQRAVELGAEETEEALEHRHFQRLHATGQVTCTKHCYPDEATARAELTARQKQASSPLHRRRHPGPPPTLRAHECPTCGFWHLTQQPAP